MNNGLIVSISIMNTIYQQLEQLNAISKLINSVPINNYTMVLDIAILISTNFFRADNSVLFIKDKVFTNDNLVLASHNIRDIDSFTIHFFEPLPLFYTILKDENRVQLKNSGNFETAPYIGTSALALPLITNGEPFGLLIVNNPIDFLSEGDDYFIEMVSTMLSTIIYNSILFRKRELLLKEIEDKKTELDISRNQMNELTLSIVGALEDASLIRDEETGTHIRRVSTYSEIIATYYGLDQSFIEKIKLYSGLHDIGKLAVKYDILHKPDTYTSEEFGIMKEHCNFGYRIINKQGIDDVAKNIVLYHHEKYDGTGYPSGLKGTSIPIEARIVALADVFDALSTKRVYKGEMDDEKIKKLILSEKGKHFDPDLVDIFIANYDRILKIKDELTFHLE